MFTTMQNVKAGKRNLFFVVTSLTNIVHMNDKITSHFYRILQRRETKPLITNHRHPTPHLDLRNYATSLHLILFPPLLLSDLCFILLDIQLTY